MKFYVLIVLRLVEVEMENGCQIFFFQWRPTVLSKVVPSRTCFFRPEQTIAYDIHVSFHRKHSKLLNMENSNTPCLYSQWLKTCYIVQKFYWANKRDSLIYDVFTPFWLDYDLSCLITHVTLTLDGVTSFQRVKNVTNMCRHLR